MSKVMAPKTVLLLKTNLIPSPKLCMIGSPIFDLKLVSFQFGIKPVMQKIEQAKTEHIDQCTLLM
jgi:hypothetical protein